MIVLNREEFKILVPQGKTENPTTEPPKLPTDDGTKPIVFDEEEIEKVKDWEQIRKDLDDTFSEVNPSGNGIEDGGEKPKEGGEEGGGEKPKEGGEEGGGEKPKEGGEEGGGEKPKEGGEQGGGEKPKEGGEQGGGEKPKEGGEEGGGKYEETAEEKKLRLRIKAIKDHNIIVNSLNKVKEFYVKNEKIMSNSVKGKFTKKIDKLESIVEKSLKTINN